jgi:hypothetical protein
MLERTGPPKSTSEPAKRIREIAIKRHKKSQKLVGRNGSSNDEGAPHPASFSHFGEADIAKAAGAVAGVQSAGRGLYNVQDELIHFP